MSKGSCWRKISGNELPNAEAFLKNREKFCVAASARFLRMREGRNHIWYLPGPEGDIAALLLHSRQSLFPVFDKNTQIPGPRFLNRFLGKIPIHALQGLREDTEILETLMEDQGYFAVERIDYELMSLDSRSAAPVIKSCPPGLVLRSPLPADEEALFVLQSAYEQEEVLPRNAVFNPSLCRQTLKHILSSERILVACLDGQVVGKINTSAESFTRYQIGGVYVRPDCRGRGVAAKMTAVFVQSLLDTGKGITLFVKKRNASARAVYRKAGFNTLADYRICYY